MDSFAGTDGTAGQIPGGLFLCAGAVLESHRLAVGVPADTKCQIWAKMMRRHLNIEPKVSQSGPNASPRHPNGDPGAPKECPKVSQRREPKATQRETKEMQCGPQRTPWHFKATSKETYTHKNSRSTALAATSDVIAIRFITLP